jgi:hypothetical protein
VLHNVLNLRSDCASALGYLEVIVYVFETLFDFPGSHSELSTLIDTLANIMRHCLESWKYAMMILGVLQPYMSLGEIIREDFNLVYDSNRWSNIMRIDVQLI